MRLLGTSWILMLPGGTTIYEMWDSVAVSLLNCQSSGWGSNRSQDWFALSAPPVCPNQLSYNQCIMAQCKVMQYKVKVMQCKVKVMQFKVM